MNINELITSPYLYVRFLWIISALIFIVMIRNRIKSNLKQEWDVEFEFSWPFRRNILHTLIKMYSQIEDMDSLKLAELLRNEICINSAIAFEKPQAFFVRHRGDPHIMFEYFKDRDLLRFISNPRVWAHENGGVRYIFFGLIKRNAITQHYLNRLYSIIDSFTTQIYTAS